MKMPTLIFILAGIAFIAANALFVVDERQQAIVLQFGEFKQDHQEPGLKFKIPFIQDVTYYPAQAIKLDHKPIGQITLLDQKRLEVDSFAYYRINDPLEFYKTLTNLDIAEDRIASRIESVMRDSLGRYTLEEILSKKRYAIMEEIRNNVGTAVKPLGIEILDVRMRRADLPQGNTNRIVELMISERTKEAKDLRANGDKIALEITSTADKKRTILLAEAEAEAQNLRGEGDAQAIKIYADAFGRDPKFFEFYRSLDAYKKALKDNQTTYILDRDDAFLKYMEQGAR